MTVFVRTDPFLSIRSMSLSLLRWYFIVESARFSCSAKSSLVIEGWKMIALSTEVAVFPNTGGLCFLGAFHGNSKGKSE